MSYVYAELRPDLFTEAGVEELTRIRHNVENALKVAGAVRALEAMSGGTVDNWLQMAVLDYMVEKGEIREIPQDAVWVQHRVFVSGREKF